MISERMRKLVHGVCGCNFQPYTLDALHNAIAELESKTQWKSVKGVDPATLRYPVLISFKGGSYMAMDFAAEFAQFVHYGYTHYIEIPTFNPKD